MLLNLLLTRQQDLNFDRGYNELSFPAPNIHVDNVSGVEGNHSGQDQDPELFARRLQLLLSNTRITASTFSHRF